MLRKLLSMAYALLLVLSLSFTTSSVPVQAASTTSAPLPTSLAAGYDYTCSLMNDGTVDCWGSNRYGQLGNNSLTLHPFPVNVTNLAGQVTALDAGAYHTCALISGGSVQCWGLNSSGQLGIGTVANTPVPTTVGGLSGVTQIAAGYAYTCALIDGGASGTVKCWGDDSFGQLGNGAISNTPVTSPAAISGLNGVAEISASLDHTCALLNNRTTIDCWGKNSYGELGTGSAGPSPVTTPVSVDLSLSSGITITSIAAGAQQTCAVLSSGGVYCWGDGSLGQMGNNAADQSQNPTPVQVYQLTDAVALSAGGNAETGHTCALTSATGVVCWGDNSYGQLGDGSDTDRNIPVQVTGLTSGVTSIATGVDHTCALMNDHTIRCWGSDSAGELGDGVLSISPTSLNVNSFSGGVSLIGMGDRGTCALVNGQVYCWGNNRDGQVNATNSVNQPAPVLVSGLTGPVTQVDGGLGQTCALANGSVMCWGNLDPTTDIINSPASIGGLSGGVSSISVTNLQGCAVVNGAARCWGDNSNDQLGDGTTTSSYTTSVAVTGLTGTVTQVSTGQWFSCALMSTGTVWCWGNNAAGQLGSDPAVHPASSTPLQVGGLSSVLMIAAGQDSACALVQGGTVRCWGNNGQGQLGDGGLEASTFNPVPVSGLTGGVTEITAGGYHTCALVNSGVECWGFNSFGQLGNGLTTLSKVPSVVTGLSSGVIDVAAGGINYDEEQTCAITSTGTLKCWGGDEYGQLGDNLPIQRSYPVKVLGLAGVPEIGINYTGGQPGSYFRVAVTGFPAGATLAITINNQHSGNVTTSSEGYAIFHIKDNAPSQGSIPVTVSASSGSASTSFTLAQNSTAHIQEGSGLVFFIDPRFIYLPFMKK